MKWQDRILLNVISKKIIIWLEPTNLIYLSKVFILIKKFKPSPFFNFIFYGYNLDKNFYKNKKAYFKKYSNPGNLDLEE